MIPQFNIPKDESTNIAISKRATKTYKDRVKSISGKVDGVEAIEQTIDHIINTERYAYVIYPDWYGMEKEKYVGQSFEYFQATIENDLRDALTQDDRILDVRANEINKLSIDSAECKFTAYTLEGEIMKEATFGL